jgi:hypothetical protein
MAAELYSLFQAHVILRSAFMFSLEMARVPELALRNANTLEDVKYLQGQIHSLERFATTLITQMEFLEESKEPSND